MPPLIRSTLIFLIYAAVSLAFAAPSWAGPRVDISAKDCRRLVKYAPSGGVAYKPGADVRGKKVKSADLGDNLRITVPDVLSFPLDMDLIDYGITSLTSIGVVTFDLQTGKLFYNGQPLSGGAEVELAAKCRKLL